MHDCLFILGPESGYAGLGVNEYAASERVRRQIRHHPVQTVRSERYLHPSRELLEEIQMTGDMLFPKS
jgi:hypothetical protein